MNKYYSSRIPYYRWLFLTLILFSLQSKALTQDSVQISINAVNKPIEVVFKQIENQTGYTFYYGKPTLNGDEVVTVQMQRSSLSSIMNVLLRGRNIAWAVKDKSIILTRRAVSENTNAAVLDTVPKVSISGSIVDKSGAPIAGATVSLRGQAMGQATNNLGQFRFANIPANTTLIISSVGFKAKQIRLEGEAELRISLDSAITDIQKVEVVSNGYQIIAKERVTGSFFKIDNELFNRRVGASVLDRIKDLVPGVYSIPGGVGSKPLDNLTIRGVSTINANKQPLLVVDNFIYDGDPNALNPNDVESITILRDAAAASIWGVRAGNGVIVVTMKKGRFANRPIVSFNTNITLVEKPDLSRLPVVPSKEVISLERKRFDAGYYNSTLNNRTSYPLVSQIIEILSEKRAGSISSGEAEAQISLLESHDIRDDINKYLLQTAIAEQYALNISGGGGNYQYYGSIGYDRSRPNNININSDRFTIRFSNIWQPMKKLQIRAEVNWGQSNDQSRNSIGTVNYNTLLNSPYHRLAGENGDALSIPAKLRMKYVDTVKFPGQLDWHYIPIDEAKNGDSRNRSFNTRLNVGINYIIIAGLKLDVNYQWQKTNVDSRNISSLSTFMTRDLINSFTTVGTGGAPVYPYPLGAIYSNSNNDQTAWNLRGVLNFDRSFNAHDISIMGGLETREFISETLVLPTQYGYSSQTSTFGTLATGSWIRRPNRSSQTISPSLASLRGTINRFGSYFGNVAYTYNDKYAITGSARVDQSNFFGVKANDRKVPLWSVGMAWSVSKEGFYNIGWLPILKLRTTFGYSGNVNAGISPLATATYSNPADPLYVPYAQLNSSPNPQLRWERVKNINLGLDFGVKNQILSGNIEFFKKDGLDLISRIDVDPTSGFNTYNGNNSSIQTKGFDFSITSRNFDRIFKWYTTLIFAYQNDKVVSYSVKPPSIGQISEAIIIGKPLSNIYSYRWAGLNPKNGDAQYYINNQLVGSINLGKEKQEDLVYGGQINPPVFGAIRNDLSFRNFALSFNVTYQMGHFFRRKSFSGSFGSTSGIQLWQHKDYLNSWKVPGDEARTNVPGFLDSYSDNRYTVYKDSDILLEKADHIRLQDIRISYEIAKMLKILPFSRLSIYVYATNIGFLWKASMYNPDTGDDILLTPRQKTLAIGMNINF